MAKQDFNSVWHSVNYFRTPSRPGLQVNGHDVHIHQRGDTLIVESLPNKEKSYLVMRLKLDGRIAIGTWEESSSPTGDYEGEIYSGAVQFVLSEDGSRFDGMYTTIDRRVEVKCNFWEICRKK